MKNLPIKVLYIDDDPDDVELVKDALLKTCVEVKYNLVYAEHGEHAIDLLKDPNYDIVILDYHLPRLNGLEILRHIRSNPNLHHLPVLMLSGEPNPRVVDEAKSLGVKGFFKKPVDLETFNRVFRAICHEWFKPLSDGKNS